MSTSRVESFSDAVIAVAATLLVLKVTVPMVQGSETHGHALGNPWQPPEVRTLGALYDTGDEPGDTLLVVYHADGDSGRFLLPGGRFTVLLDSGEGGRTGPVAGALELGPWSVVILRHEA